MIDLAGEIPSPLNLPELRNYFITPENPGFGRRRKIMALSLAGLADASFMLLHQAGIIKKLPDLPGKIFDANKVTISEKAYDMGLPDTALATAVYASTLVLASWGGDRSLYRNRWCDRALFVATAANAAAAGQYLLNMIFRQKRICIYCVSGAAINFLSVKYAWEEMRQ